MTLYSISYDLTKAQDEDYERLSAKIAEFPHIHPMQSLWIIKTTLPLEFVCKCIESCIDANDLFFISEIHAGTYTGKLEKMEEAQFLNVF